MSTVLEVYEDLAKIRLFQHPGKMLNSYEPDVIRRIISAGLFNETAADEFVLWFGTAQWEVPDHIWQAATKVGYARINPDWRKTGNAFGIELLPAFHKRRKELYCQIRSAARQVEY